MHQMYHTFNNLFLQIIYLCTYYEMLQKWKKSDNIFFYSKINKNKHFLCLKIVYTNVFSSIKLYLKYLFYCLHTSCCQKIKNNIQFMDFIL